MSGSSEVSVAWSTAEMSETLYSELLGAAEKLEAVRDILVLHFVTNHVFR